MNPKIMKLRGELEKNKGKISDLQGRNRELDKQIRELEDTDIIGSAYTGHFGKGGVEP